MRMKVATMLLMLTVLMVRIAMMGFSTEVRLTVMMMITRTTLMMMRVAMMLTLLMMLMVLMMRMMMMPTTRLTTMTMAKVLLGTMRMRDSMTRMRRKMRMMLMKTLAALAAMMVGTLYAMKIQTMIKTMIKMMPTITTLTMTMTKMNVMSVRKQNHAHNLPLLQMILGLFTASLLAPNLRLLRSHSLATMCYQNTQGHTAGAHQRSGVCTAAGTTLDPSAMYGGMERLNIASM